MSRPLRLEFPGSFWHITHRGNERRPTFYEDADRIRFLELLAEAVRRFAWRVSAYALMPNHYHLLIELSEVNTLSRGMAWLNGKYVQWFNRAHARVGHLFQGRFKSLLIEKESHGLEVQRYVVLNPVRAGIVERPEDDRWTSYRALIGSVTPPPWLAIDDVFRLFADDRDVARELYRAFVEEGIGSTRCPWDELVGSMYLGSIDWLERVRDRVESRPQPSEVTRAQRHVLNPTMAEIVRAVAGALDVPEERIRHGHGGLPRAVTAWIGYYEGRLRNSEIAAGLRLRSDGHVTKIVDACEHQLRTNAALRACVDDCLTTLRGENRESKT